MPPSWAASNKHGLQVKGGDPAALLCSAETSHVVLHADMKSSEQERYGSVEAHPEEGHKNHRII